MTILSALDDFFRELKKDGISKGDVAEKIGVTPSYLSKMLTGEKPVTDSFTSALHKHYGPVLKKLGINLKKIEPGYLEQAESESRVEEPQVSYGAIGQSIFNLTESSQKISEAYLINQKNIERLIAILEKQAGKASLMELALPGTPGTETKNPRKQKKPAG